MTGPRYRPVPGRHLDPRPPRPADRRHWARRRARDTARAVTRGIGPRRRPHPQRRHGTGLLARRPRAV